MKTHKTTDQELDIIYSYIDYLLRRGQFKLVDALLFELTTFVKSPYNKKGENLTKDEILGYLTCCLSARSKLNNYGFFYHNVQNLFSKEELVGLEPKE